MFHMSKKCGKNTGETFDLASYWQASYENWLGYKIFILLVLALISYSFLQITSGNYTWKWKGTSPREFFKLSKKSLPHGCFHNLATFCKWFSGKNKGKKQQNYKKLKKIWYFNVINIAECWCEVGSTSEVSVINESSSMQLLVALFFQMVVWFMDNLLCLCDVWKGRSYVNTNVSVSSIFNNGHFYLK